MIKIIYKFKAKYYSKLKLEDSKVTCFTVGGTKSVIWSFAFKVPPDRGNGLNGFNGQSQINPTAEF